MPKSRQRRKAPGKRRPPVPAARPQRPPWPARRVALALGVLAWLTFNANLRVIGAGDTYAARYQPFLLFEHGTLLLDPLADLVRHDFPSPYWMRKTADGRLASMYPVMTPLLVTPLYLPAEAWLRLRGATDLRLRRVAYVMEKLAASTIAAITVAWLYLLLRRRVSRRAALWTALAFAFGTNTWMTGSQALWQHGIGELLVVAALWFALAPESDTVAGAGCGLACGLLVANRPPDALLAAPIALVFLWQRRRALLSFAPAALAPVGAAAAYNLAIFHDLRGGYAATGLSSDFLSHGVSPAGIAGLLFSPAKGLFVFSPFLLAAPLALRRRPDAHRAWDWACAAAIVLIVLFYATTDWRGGSSYGPRFLTDSLPLFAWLVAAAWDASRRALAMAIALLVVPAVAFQVIGAFYYSGLSDRGIDIVSRAPFPQVWHLTNFPPLAELASARPSLTIAKLLLDRSFVPGN